MTITKTPVGDCIIEAGTVLTGLARSGVMQMRRDVGVRVANGIIAQMGPCRRLVMAMIICPDMVRATLLLCPVSSTAITISA